MAQRTRPHLPPAGPDRSIAPAEHVAAVARAIASMAGVATSISTRQRVTDTESLTIRRLLPALAGRYRLEVTNDTSDDVLTITFTRKATRDRDDRAAARS